MATSRSSVQLPFLLQAPPSSGRPSPMPLCINNNLLPDFYDDANYQVYTKCRTGTGREKQTTRSAYTEFQVGFSIAISDP